MMNSSMNDTKKQCAPPIAPELLAVMATHIVMNVKPTGGE
jgi:hypothetical protein